MVLVNPEVSFVLYHNDTELFNLPAYPLRQRIMGVFGKKINHDLLSFDVATTMVHVSGFVGNPESARKKGARQFFFVNGRYMRHPYFHRAVMEAYEHLVPQGEQVSYFIYFEVDPANIDVNIHPTKTEIKFENEQAIWQILAAAIKETLGKFNAVPSIDFDTEGRPDIPAFESDSFAGIEPPQTSFNPSYNPFLTEASLGEERTERPQAGTYSSTAAMFGGGKTIPSKVNRPKEVEWQPLYEGLENSSAKVEEPGVEIPAPKEPAPAVEMASSHYQYKGRYILTSIKSGLMIIDQQRAHIRVLYERYLAQIQQQKGVSQKVLFPEMVQLPMSEVPILEEILPDILHLGFDISDLGGGSYAIQGVPADIAGLNPVELVQRMVHLTMEKGSSARSEVQSELALTLARAAAIVPGQVLSAQEMNALVEELLCLATPNYTPDGKTVLTVLAEKDLEKMFN
jgi:DNA mismatch repair protein MutL